MGSKWVFQSFVTSHLNMWKIILKVMSMDEEKLQLKKLSFS